MSQPKPERTVASVQGLFPPLRASSSSAIVAPFGRANMSRRMACLEPSRHGIGAWPGGRRLVPLRARGAFSAFALTGAGAFAFGAAARASSMIAAVRFTAVLRSEKRLTDFLFRLSATAL